MLAWIEAHPGLAAWVQAVGTIAALLVALLLPHLHRRSVERDAARACHVSVKITIDTIWSGFFCIAGTRSLDRAEFLTELKHRVVELRTLPIGQLPERAAMHFYDFVAHIASVHSTLEGDEFDGDTYARTTAEAALRKLLNAAMIAPAIIDPQQLTQTLKTFEELNQHHFEEEANSTSSDEDDE